MNIHPIIVHFPIALLIVYTLLELISLCSQTLASRLYLTKIICLWLGTIGSFFALQSGEVAQDFLGRSPLIHQHEEFAEKSHMIYVLLSLVYLISTICKQWFTSSLVTTWISSWLVRLMCTVGGIVGVVLLTITGALGGAIVRGEQSDPISQRAVQTFVGPSIQDINSSQKNINKKESPTSTIQIGKVDEFSDINKQDIESDNRSDDEGKEKSDLSPASISGLTSYSMDQIKQHDTEGSCRTIINNTVYDLTAFASKHPGGDLNIFKLCGKDGTQAFTRKHDGQEKPQQTLKGFEIGILK